MVEALRFAAAAFFVLGLAACSSVPETAYEGSGDEPAQWERGEIVTPDRPLKCVKFARERSGIDIHGDAWTWWDQAEGRYARDAMPETGAVLVLTGYAGDKRAHLAVVREMESPRVIRVDHANWLNDGRIYLDDPVADVSPDNDWSQVRVYNLRDGGWGTNVYRVQGFILPGKDESEPLRVSRR
ncbi:MAG TPA: CHAP domain-containing protein [Rhizomicrobium sp.]|nr:CHAP domain-containing protein [Rhizomicrobium sp.]